MLVEINNYFSFLLVTPRKLQYFIIFIKEQCPVSLVLDQRGDINQAVTTNFHLSFRLSTSCHSLLCEETTKKCLGRGTL